MEGAGCEEVEEADVEVDVAAAAVMVVENMAVGAGAAAGVVVQAVFGLDHDIGCVVDSRGHAG